MASSSYTALTGRWRWTLVQKSQFCKVAEKKNIDIENENDRKKTSKFLLSGQLLTPTLTTPAGQVASLAHEMIGAHR